MPVNEAQPAAFRVPVAECIPNNAWGLDHGKAGFLKIDARLRPRSEPIVNLDFSGVPRFDSSCAREVIVNLVRKYRGARWFFLSGLANESVRENIDAALVKSEVTVLERLSKNNFQVLGVPLKGHLKDTLQVVEKLGSTTSKEVAARLNLALPACINRLKDLSDAGLVFRGDGSAGSGGREFLFAALR